MEDHESVDEPPRANLDGLEVVFPLLVLKPKNSTPRAGKSGRSTILRSKFFESIVIHMPTIEFVDFGAVILIFLSPS